MSTPAGKNRVGKDGVGKGRPTPKRSEAQKRRSGPVAPPPQTRKEAAQRAREQAKSSRTRSKEATARGDDRYFAPRDAGPVRALVRDTVDSRRNIGVLLLPLALLLVVAQLSGNRRILDIALTIWLAGVLAMFTDIALIVRSIRKRVRAEFPDERKLRNHVAYGLLRSTVFRKLRLPPPRVSPGGPRPS